MCKDEIYEGVYCVVSKELADKICYGCSESNCISLCPKMEIFDNLTEIMVDKAIDYIKRECKTQYMLSKIKTK